MNLRYNTTIRFVMGLLVIAMSSLTIISCGSAKNRKQRTTTIRVNSKEQPNTRKTTTTTTVVKTKKRPPRKAEKKGSITRQKINAIVAHAKAFEGTRYRYGGTTKRGMDCSGLVYTAFQKEAIELPRTSKAMATKGVEISLKKIAIGDLVFFKTSKVKKNINHVGIVVGVQDEIRFIHASVSKGVTISSLNERYWNRCYTKAKRVL